jgi:nucleoid DNA-binding protein
MPPLRSLISYDAYYVKLKTSKQVDEIAKIYVQHTSLAWQNHAVLFIWRKILNKAELIEALAKETDMSKAAAGRAVSALVDIITKTVAKKQDVQLIGFGTFKAAKRAARVGKNPRTGEKLKIAAATVPRFSAGAAFKAAVNKKK